MNGPNHYREAERLLMLSEGDPAELTDYRVADAGVHATLAVAAATAMAGDLDVWAWRAWERGADGRGEHA